MQITKTVRITGESDDSIEAAIAAVLERATASLRDVQTYEVVRVAGRLDERVGWYRETKRTLYNVRGRVTDVTKVLDEAERDHDLSHRDLCEAEQAMRNLEEEL